MPVRAPRLLVLLWLLAIASLCAVSPPSAYAEWYSDDRDVHWFIVSGHGGHVWETRSIKRLDVARLIYRFDLRLLSKATLVLETEFDFEEAWDFGFVQISTDDGHTWVSMTDRESHVTSKHDPEALRAIVNNLPGFTGKSNGWITEIFDLTRYTGKVVAVALVYMTDWYALGEGWMVDNLAVPELGFVDDAEHGPSLGTRIEAPADSDSDGLLDYIELDLGTSPKNSDTDGDGPTDKDGVSKYGSSPLKADTDDDGLIDGREVQLSTNPLSPDTDADLWKDNIDPMPLDAIVPNIVIIVVVSFAALLVFWRTASSRRTSSRATSPLAGGRSEVEAVVEDEKVEYARRLDKLEELWRRRENSESVYLTMKAELEEKLRS